MTQEQKLQKLEKLRTLWKEAKTDVDRKILEKRALLIKFTLPKELISPIDN